MFLKINAPKWPIHFHAGSIADSTKTVSDKTIYLSPDAETPLMEFDDNTNFVIGGLIDRSVIKNASLDQSKTLNLQA